MDDFLSMVIIIAAAIMVYLAVVAYVVMLALMFASAASDGAVPDLGYVASLWLTVAAVAITSPGRIGR